MTTYCKKVMIRQNRSWFTPTHGGTYNFSIFFFRASSFTLYFGRISLGNQEEGTLAVTTTEYVTHPAYSYQTLNNDIALIRLPAPLTYTGITAPIYLRIFPNRFFRSYSCSTSTRSWWRGASGQRGDHKWMGSNQRTTRQHQRRPQLSHPERDHKRSMYLVFHKCFCHQHHSLCYWNTAIQKHLQCKCLYSKKFFHFRYCCYTGK